MELGMLGDVGDSADDGPDSADEEEEDWGICIFNGSPASAEADMSRADEKSFNMARSQMCVQYGTGEPFSWTLWCRVWF